MIKYVDIYCPLGEGRYCNKERCAWWENRTQHCAVLLISFPIAKSLSKEVPPQLETVSLEGRTY